MLHLRVYAPAALTESVVQVLRDGSVFYAAAVDEADRLGEQDLMRTLADTSGGAIMWNVVMFCVAAFLLLFSLLLALRMRLEQSRALAAIPTARRGTLDGMTSP